MGESIATGMNALACDKRFVPLENVAADGYGFAHSGQELLDHSARFGEFETQSSRPGIEKRAGEYLGTKCVFDLSSQIHFLPFNVDFCLFNTRVKSV